MSQTKNEAGEENFMPYLDTGRDQAKIIEVQLKKRETRDRLRALRAEMKSLDIELIKAGASGVDLVLMCW